MSVWVDIFHFAFDKIKLQKYCIGMGIKNSGIMVFNGLEPLKGLEEPRRRPDSTVMSSEVLGGWTCEWRKVISVFKNERIDRDILTIQQP